MVSFHLNGQIMKITTNLIGLLSLALFGLASLHGRETPPAVDLREYQSPLCSQGGRTACTYYPPIGALEAAYKRKGIDVSLSVEHLIWLRNVTSLKRTVKDSKVNENNLAFLTGGGLSVNFDILAHYGVSRSQYFPYLNDHEDYKASYYRGFDVTDYKWFEPHRQLSLNRFNLDSHQLPDVARHDAHYGIKDYVFFRGNDCKNVSKIEEILASQHEVAINVFVSYPKYPQDKSRGDIPPVVWYVPPDAVPKQADSHAMLIVGYDRPRQFFIVKNSWGPTKTGFEESKLPEGWKDIAKYKGYTLMHYNYLKGNREAAYIKEVAEPNDSGFDRQRALGLWRFQIVEKVSSKPVVEGVLAWRRLVEDNKSVNRIGDWYGPDGMQCRVNAEWECKDPSKITLIMDLDRPQLEPTKKDGTKFHGRISLPLQHEGTVKGESIIMSGEEKLLFGHKVTDLSFKLSQSLDKNLLDGWKTPAEKAKSEVPNIR